MFFHYSSFIPLVLVLFIWGTFVTLCVTVTNILLLLLLSTQIQDNLDIQRTTRRKQLNLPMWSPLLNSHLYLGWNHLFLTFHRKFHVNWTSFRDTWISSTWVRDSSLVFWTQTITKDVKLVTFWLVLVKILSYKDHCSFKRSPVL
jgi:hypothetical protein